MSVTITCGDQSLDSLTFETEQTNELVVTITYTRSGSPIPGDSVVQAALYDGDTMVLGSNITLASETNGVFAGVFPLIPSLETGRAYDLRLMADIGPTRVIDKRLEVTTV